jgi:hypothetical protein
MSSPRLVAPTSLAYISQPVDVPSVDVGREESRGVIVYRGVQPSALRVAADYAIGASERREP